VKALQAMLVKRKLKGSDVVDGSVGAVTAEAIRNFQREAGLVEDGIVGTKTRQLLTATGLLDDSAQIFEKLAPADGGASITWSLTRETVPPYLDEAVVADEFAAAFAVWAGPTGHTFERIEEGGQVTVSWSDLSDRNAGLWDGPGGKLAEATPTSITFDSAEFWELQGKPHAHRATEPDDFWADASHFELLPVALHEVGHVIGLGHSANPADVMSPYYFKGRIELSEGDKAAAAALVA